MAERTSSVRFNNDDPIVFYYESLEYEPEEESFIASSSNLLSKKGFKTSFFFRSRNKFKDSQSEWEKSSHKSKESKGGENTSDKEKKKQKDYDENMETKYVNRSVDEVQGSNWSDQELYSNLSTAETELDFDPESETNSESLEERANATYFYNVLHKLIDAMCNKTRFKCLETSTEPCESCKVMEELVLRLFDITTLEDVILERSIRGICGYLFCIKASNRSRSKSKYKIDLLSKSIFKRKEYESFCSVKCLEKNEKLALKVMSSPVEQGTFTPEDMRTADTEGLRKLHEGMLLLPECSSLPTRELLNLCKETVDSLNTVVRPRNEGKEQVKSRFDTKMMKKQSKVEKTKLFDILERFDSFRGLSETSLPVMKVNEMFRKQLLSKLNEEKKETKVDQVCQPDLEVLSAQEQLGSFSTLWYLLSNMVTKDTKKFVNHGLVKKLKFYEQFEPLQAYCLKDVPEILAPTMNLHVHYILSTFKTVKSKMFNQNSVIPLSYVLKYILLINRHHLPINYPEIKHLDKSSSSELKVKPYLKFGKKRETNPSEDYDKVTDLEKEECYANMVRELEETLYKSFKLEKEHLNILLELLRDD